MPIYSIGFNSGGKFPTTDKLGKKLIARRKWESMLRRCYSNKSLMSFPAYNGCEVCEEWFDYQVFAEWFHNHYIEGFELDKDILFKGNKIYSPKTCCFVPGNINKLLESNKAKRKPGGIIGTYWLPKRDRWQSQCKTQTGRITLGYYQKQEDAFQAYKMFKEKLIKEVAEEYKHQISEQCYDALINYRVQITD